MQAEGVLLLAGFWNILSSSQAPDLVDLNIIAGFQKMLCLMQLFSECRLLMGFSALAAHSE